jgi:MoxR-like ATPase
MRRFEVFLPMDPPVSRTEEEILLSFREKTNPFSLREKTVL